MSDIVKSDPRALLDYAQAAWEQYSTHRQKFVDALQLVYETQAYKVDGFDTMQEYIGNRFLLGASSARKYVMMCRRYQQFPRLKELEYTQALILAPHITKENENEMVDRAINHSVSETKALLPPGESYLFTARFHGAEEYNHFLDAIELGKKIVPTDSVAVVLSAMGQEVYGTWLGMAEGHGGLDSVTLATFERDGWICQGCGKRNNLTRHSALQPHSKAQVDDCVTLCHEADGSGCHDLIHSEKAGIESLGSGKFRFYKKEDGT